MPWGLKRYQQTGDVHFITFSCHRRAPLLESAQARDTFVITLEKVRRWYGFYVTGFVVMPEHVHLLLSEPERSNLAVALQMLKQVVSQTLSDHGEPAHTSRHTKPGAPSFSRSVREGGASKHHDPFWQPRYYDFNIYRQQKLMEKLDYMHLNPVRRGLVAVPEDWTWSSARHYATGDAGWRLNRTGQHVAASSLEWIRRFAAAT
jgi:putative transposase